MKKELLHRTKMFAIEVWKLCQTLPKEFLDYKRQLVRCSSSVGANYRAACRAKSTRDFIYKLKIVEEELDESLFFIEIISEISEKEKPKWQSIYAEGDQLLAIIVKSLITLREKQKNNG
jgi:four helix bundle protein